MELFRIDGSRIRATDHDEITQNSVNAVYQKSRRFRYREVTHTDPWRRCQCCKHFLSFEYQDGNGLETFLVPHCGFFLKEINVQDEVKYRTVYRTIVDRLEIARVDGFSGECDAFLAEPEVVKAYQALVGKKDFSDKASQNALQVLREYGRE